MENVIENLEKRKQALLAKFKELNGHKPYGKNGYAVHPPLSDMSFHTFEEQPENTFKLMNFLLPPKDDFFAGQLCLYIGYGQYVNIPRGFLQNGFGYIGEKGWRIPSSNTFDYSIKDLKESGFVLVE